MRFSLKAYVIASIIVVASLVGYVCMNHIDRVMSDGLRSIQQKQIESVFQITTSTLNMMKDELERGSRVLRSDNDLASSFVLATETKDVSLIQNKLQHLQAKMNLDYVDILTIDGRFVSGSLSFASPNTFQSHPGKDGFFLRESDSSVLLYFFSALELYGEPVGTLVLGRDLAKSLQTKVIDLTGAQLSFSLQKPNETTSSPKDLVECKEIFSTGEIPLFAKVQVGTTQFDRIITDSRKNLIIWLGLSFLLLLFLIFILFERGFLKQLDSLLRLIRKTSTSIDSCQIPSLQIRTSRIKEIDVVAKAFGKVVQNLSVYDNKIKEQSKREAEMQKDLAVAELAKQVAHDIRSPIGTLEGVIKLAESGRFELIDQTGRNAIQLIKDIADTLDPYQSLDSKEKIQKIFPLIGEVISEMRIRYADVIFLMEVENDKIDVAAKIQAVEFKRILSNILNNSVEALKKLNREIRVRLLEKIPGKVLIEISDRGVGIDQHLLSEIGKLGVSVGKQNGRGRGIYYAKQTLERWAGNFQISSVKGEGTTVTIELPLQEMQSNYPILPVDKNDGVIKSAIETNSDVDLVLIDNFKYTRDSWTAIAKRLKLNLITLEEPNEQMLLNFKRDIPLFIDLDLDHGISGFDVAKNLSANGFTNIFITTGNIRAIEESTREKPSFICGIVDKQFPWWLKNRKHDSRLSLELN